MNSIASSRAFVRAALAALLLAGASAASGSGDVEIRGVVLRPPPRDARPEAYGTTALTMVKVAASRCAPIGGTTASIAAEDYVQPTSGPGYFDCPLNLPAGARPIRVDVLTHDINDAAAVTAAFVYCPNQVPGLACNAAGMASSVGTLAAPLDGKFSVDVSPYALTVDKSANLYFVRVVVPVTGGSLRFRDVDVYYRLQISGAPATPTFGDVPASHTYFKAIEALAASGITGGCGNGNFCPANYVTRGEVAILFARALGLNFPN